MIDRFNAAELLAYRARTGETPPELEDILDNLGDGGLGTAMFIHGLDASKFDPEKLEGSDINEERLDALFEGAAPTAEELEAWQRQVRREIADSGEGPWNPAILWKVTGDDGVTVYATVLGEDGGSWAALFGPFATAEEALADLRSRGEVSEVSWPDNAPGS